jgi:hydrogenase maturation protease
MKSNLTRIIGIGNPLMGDDGIGIRAVQELHKVRLPESVELIDGGCGGLQLLPLFAGCQHLVIIDAADFGARPGQIRILGNNELPLLPFPKPRLSGHLFCLPELLQAAEKTEQLPPLSLILVQVKSCQPRPKLSDELQSALPKLLQTAIKTITSRSTTAPKNHSRTIAKRSTKA